MSKPYLWVDDMRTPPDFYAETKTWDVAEDYDEAIKFIRSTKYEIISLDFDLGLNENGMDILKFMNRYSFWPDAIHLHSQNPVGKKLMRDFILDSDFEGECKW
jgi:hypothetical protein